MSSQDCVLSRLERLLDLLDQRDTELSKPQEEKKMDPLYSVKIMEYYQQLTRSEEKTDPLTQRVKEIPSLALADSIQIVSQGDVVVEEKEANAEEEVFSLENLVEDHNGTAEESSGSVTGGMTKGNRMGQHQSLGPTSQSGQNNGSGPQQHKPMSSPHPEEPTTTFHNTSTQNPSHHNRVTPPLCRVTPAEIAQRKADVLCLRCDEKWHNRHLCPRKELQLLVVHEDGSEREWEGDDDATNEGYVQELKLVEMRKQIDEKFCDADQRNDVKGIVLIGNGGRFSGGFDINVFQQVHKPGGLSLMPEVSVDLVCNLMEDSRKPVVTAVEGLALGGGLELAMACHARVAAPKAQLGLRELTLGVIPGFGGTQRLPRLVGLAKATDMLLLSKSISSDEGQKLGLIDTLVRSGDLLSTSRKWALEMAAGRELFLRSLHRTDKIGSLSEARVIWKNSRQLAKKIAPNMPQHHACIEVIEEGIIHGGYSGVLKEAEVFKQLVLSDTAKALVHVFFAQRATSKVPNVTDVGLKPGAMKKVAVIGGGLRGSGIATALLLSNIRVVLKEINPKYLSKGIKSVEANMKGLVSKGKLAQDKAGKALSLLKGVLDYREFKDVDMVIDAVIENIQLKQNIFKEIEKVCPPHCNLASNTSTIDIDVIGKRRTQEEDAPSPFRRKISSSNGKEVGLGCATLRTRLFSKAGVMLGVGLLGRWRKDRLSSSSIEEASPRLRRLADQHYSTAVTWLRGETSRRIRTRQWNVLEAKEGHVMAVNGKGELEKNNPYAEGFGLLFKICVWLVVRYQEI